MKNLRTLSFLAASLGLAACGPSSGPEVSTTADAVPAPAVASGPAPTAVPQIGLVMKTLTNPFFIEMEKGARKAEKELGVSLQVKTAAQETSIEQQIQLVDDLVAAKVAAIVIAPAESQRLVPSLQKAAAAGIKLVNIDNRLDPKAIKDAGMAPVPFVSVDNDAGAFKAGTFLASLASGPAKAAILEGIRGADNARQRMEGAKRGLLAQKGISVVASETANWKIDEAYSVTKALFAKHPDVSLLFAANDMMALGALKYLQETKKTKVKVAGYDAMSEALTEIKAGTLAATIDQQAAEQGYQGVALAMRLLKGEAVPELTLIDTRLITAAELQ
ncbi:MAG: substrate-binding domain-containing protein [Rhodocyclaceae bacterium]|nr:substrate-binding domain-containing protein [Rhodocyclaceae bacterium]